MKITFPHMGNVYIAVKILFDSLKIDYVIPEPCNKETINYGVMHSPEEICLPFKIMIGNYIKCIEKGADTILLVGSCGPCRFGEYGELQMNILKNLNLGVDFIIIDTPKDIGIRELFSRLNKIGKDSKINFLKKCAALRRTVKAMELIDEIEANAHFLNGYEINSGECKKLLLECRQKVIRTNVPDKAVDILKKYRKKLNHISIEKKRKPVKIAVIGEIYTVIEPFANQYIEDKLMKYGVSISRMLTPTWWFKDLILKIIKLNALKIKKNSRKYLPFNIGGHARECIGEAVIASKKGFDGAIQIFPLGCMPEIVSKSILGKISRDINFPVLNLVVDEMTGEAGYMTRLEAFLDLLERRRENVLYGN